MKLSILSRRKSSLNKKLIQNRSRPRLCLLTENACLEFILDVIIYRFFLSLWSANHPSKASPICFCPEVSPIASPIFIEYPPSFIFSQTRNRCSKNLLISIAVNRLIFFFAIILLWAHFPAQHNINKSSHSIKSIARNTAPHLASLEWGRQNAMSHE